jgi:hypothetical protein
MTENFPDLKKGAFNEVPRAESDSLEDKRQDGAPGNDDPFGVQCEPGFPDVSKWGRNPIPILNSFMISPGTQRQRPIFLETIFIEQLLTLPFPSAPTAQERLASRTDLR